MSDGDLTLQLEAIIETEVPYTEREIEEILENTELESREEIIQKSEEKYRTGLVEQIDSRELKSIEVTTEVVEDE